MADFLFYLFAALTVGSALLMVLSRNAVNSAMFMILSFVSTAALFALLNSFLLFALQIIVYAGAVMVLFLFIIMLLNVDKTQSSRPKIVTTAASWTGFGLLLLGVYELVSQVPTESFGLKAPLYRQAGDTGIEFTTLLTTYSEALFTKYMLPVQVAGFLLLVAMVGVIIISKKLETGETPSSESSNPTAQ